MFKKKSIGISNDNNKNKKIIIISAVSGVFVLAIIVLLTTGGLSKLMGNSVTEYYCEDPSYKLEGDKCVKEIREKSALLGDVNLDNKITNEDLNLIQRYINYAEYDEPDEEVSKFAPIQIKAADVSEDGDVYYLDIDLLKTYLEQNTATYGAYQENIGTKRICADDFKLEGTECIKKDIVDAKVKITEVPDGDSKVGDNNSINNPVEVSFKPENESTKIEANKLYKINVKFDVKDKTKQYYYIWKTYKYGENDFSTECKAVKEGENSGNFIMDGTKKVNVTVYSDSDCNNQVSTFDSKEYSCTGCADGIDASLIPENDKTLVAKDSNYKMNVKFDIHDKEHKYYYIWSNYLNGEKNYSTACTEAKEGEHGGSFKVNGYRRVKVTVYSDSACKNRIKEVESKTYVYDGIIPNVSSDVEVFAAIEPLKYRYRDISTGKVVEEYNIKDINYVPQNTDLFLKINFLVRDQSKKYSYRWHNNGTYNTKNNEYECNPIPKDLTETKIVTLKTNYIPIYSSEPVPNKGFQADFDLYEGENCIWPVRGVEKITSKKYSFKNYTIRFDSNGGKIDRTTDKTKDVVIGYNQKFKLPYNSFEGNTINANNGTFVMYKDGYDLIGFKARNSKGLYMCYTNSKKTNKAFTNKDNCNKYGYYIYGKMSTIVNITSKDNEIITFVAQWTNNPVSIKTSSLTYKAYKAGTKISDKITFKVNDTYNTYYYKWVYAKVKTYPNSAIYNSISHFVKEYDPYSVTNKYSYGMPDISGLDATRKNWPFGWSFSTSPCKKITNNLTISPLIKVDSSITAGMIMVYGDSSCQQPIYSEKPVHKITGLYKCAVNDIQAGKCK